jgi:hypothetical protein
MEALKVESEFGARLGFQRETDHSPESSSGGARGVHSIRLKRLRMQNESSRRLKPVKKKAKAHIRWMAR